MLRSWYDAPSSTANPTEEAPCPHLEGAANWRRREVLLRRGLCGLTAAVVRELVSAKLGATARQHLCCMAFSCWLRVVASCSVRMVAARQLLLRSALDAWVACAAVPRFEFVHAVAALRGASRGLRVAWAAWLGRWLWCGLCAQVRVRGHASHLRRGFAALTRHGSLAHADHLLLGRGGWHQTVGGRRVVARAWWLWASRCSCLAATAHRLDAATAETHRLACRRAVRDWRRACDSAARRSVRLCAAARSCDTTRCRRAALALHRHAAWRARLARSASDAAADAVARGLLQWRVWHAAQPPSLGPARAAVAAARRAAACRAVLVGLAERVDAAARRCAAAQAVRARMLALGFDQIGVASSWAVQQRVRRVARVELRHRGQLLGAWSRWGDLTEQRARGAASMLQLEQRELRRAWRGLACEAGWAAYSRALFETADMWLSTHALRLGLRRWWRAVELDAVRRYGRGVARRLTRRLALAQLCSRAALVRAGRAVRRRSAEAAVAHSRGLLRCAMLQWAEDSRRVRALASRRRERTLAAQAHHGGRALLRWWVSAREQRTRRLEEARRAWLGVGVTGLGRWRRGAAASRRAARGTRLLTQLLLGPQLAAWRRHGREAAGWRWLASVARASAGRVARERRAVLLRRWRHAARQRLACQSMQARSLAWSIGHTRAVECAARAAAWRGWVGVCRRRTAATLLSSLASSSSTRFEAKSRLRRWRHASRRRSEEHAAAAVARRALASRALRLRLAGWRALSSDARGVRDRERELRAALAVERERYGLARFAYGVDRARLGAQRRALSRAAATASAQAGCIAQWSVRTRLRRHRRTQAAVGRQVAVTGKIRYRMEVVRGWRRAAEGPARGARLMRTAAVFDTLARWRAGLASWRRLVGRNMLTRAWVQVQTMFALRRCLECAARWRTRAVARRAASRAATHHLGTAAAFRGGVLLARGLRVWAYVAESRRRITILSGAPLLSSEKHRRRRGWCAFLAALAETVCASRTRAAMADLAFARTVLPAGFECWVSAARRSAASRLSRAHSLRLHGRRRASAALRAWRHRSSRGAQIEREMARRTQECRVSARARRLLRGWRGSQRHWHACASLRAAAAWLLRRRLQRGLLLWRAVWRRAWRSRAYHERKIFGAGGGEAASAEVLATPSRHAVAARRLLACTPSSRPEFPPASAARLRLTELGLSSAAASRPAPLALAFALWLRRARVRARRGAACALGRLPGPAVRRWRRRAARAAAAAAREAEAVSALYRLRSRRALTGWAARASRHGAPGPALHHTERAAYSRLSRIGLALDRWRWRCPPRSLAARPRLMFRGVRLARGLRVWSRWARWRDAELCTQAELARRAHAQLCATLARRVQRRLLGLHAAVKRRGAASGPAGGPAADMAAMAALQAQRRWVYALPRVLSSSPPGATTQVQRLLRLDAAHRGLDAFHSRRLLHLLGAASGTRALPFGGHSPSPMGPMRSPVRRTSPAAGTPDRARLLPSARGVRPSAGSPARSLGHSPGSPGKYWETASPLPTRVVQPATRPGGTPGVCSGPSPRARFTASGEVVSPVTAARPPARR